ncbi:amidase [Sphingomonas immobilis]|uniref:Amidase n=1 Tax=Sphingomonas immobilis TaxID=3063997 RepID=A0ABT9A3W9_9SPHN|nr:amidase [Sphingomonas sp. CA1-15]MDO7844039.1 amidase [Sphingomonas sp. CA1-15]
MRHLAAALLLVTAAPAAAQEIEEQSIDQLGAAMAQGKATSEGITRAYLARIAAMDRAGPSLRAVIATNPDALAAARASDARRKAGKALGPLDGIPILIKDNIETADPMATTAGSLALKDNVTRRDAPLVAGLRRAGAVILGKTNLSEWANIRSNRSMSGWSAIGGLVRNPYALDRSACGSSSGSGAAIAASFAAAAVGTETDGSVVCPSSVNGLVGFKPTVGLVSRRHVVPISHSQDTPGPMARSVMDVALLLQAMAGRDPADPATARQRQYRTAPPGYVEGLNHANLTGVRIAVLRPDMPEAMKPVYERALLTLSQAGAILVDVEQPKLAGLGEAESLVLHTELKADLNAYLATTPASVKTRTLADVIAFDAANKATEMPFFGQETFILSAKLPGLADPEYLGALAKSRRLAGKEGIDAMLATANAAILVAPTQGLAWLSDTVLGDYGDGPSASQLPAVAGYPHLTVPMGLAKGLPVGISFIATAWGDQNALDAGYVYEQASHARVAPKYLPSADVGPGLDGAK